MPDLKSELSKVITSWNDNDMPTTTAPTMTKATGHKITANSTRLTFNYVRDNPGVTRVEAMIALEKLGVKQSSSTSLLSVMVVRGNLRKAPDGGLFVTQNEYAPIPQSKPVKTIKTPDPVPQPEVVAPTPPEWTVESVIGNLNVRQALAVYMELRTVFGG
jgi:hypothetical protein